MDKLIRVFISSTFRDMHAERDYLNRFVFPELQHRCQAHGAGFVGVDLRWGVTQDEAERQGALAVCLDEIERCRPFFVCLLGDRFGWVPPPEVVPVAAFEAAREIATSGGIGSELHWLRDAWSDVTEWYELGTADIAHQWVLRRDVRPAMTDDVADRLVRLWEHFALPLAGESITAREIRHGVLEGGHPSTHSLFYLRNSGIHAHPHFPKPFVPIFVEQEGSRVEKLVRIKEEIKERGRRGGATVRTYHAHYDGLRIDPSLLPRALTAAERERLEDGVIQPEEWSGLRPHVQDAVDRYGTVAVRREDLEILGAMIVEDLWPAIQTELRRPARARDAHEVERGFHERFVTERTRRFFERAPEGERLVGRAFVGRDEEVARVVADIATLVARPAAGPRWPLVVTGAPGCGKSAFMAECARSCRERWPDAVVVAHFVGASPGSVELPNTVRSLCEALRRACRLRAKPPADPAELRAALPGFLAQSGARRRVIVFIDALNQLDPADGSHDLDWFPFAVPPGVTLVVSTLAGACLDRFRERLPAGRIFTLEAMPASDRHQLVSEHLAVRRKKLTPGQMTRLLDTRQRPDSILPLYLMVALEELCLFNEHHALDMRIDDLPPTLPELFQQVLKRLEEDHGNRRTRSVCRWLIAARSGLAESEILDLLARDEQVGEFPRLLWTRLYRSLQFYLRPVDEEPEESDGGASRLGRSTLIDFYHDQLRSAVRDRYVDEAAESSSIRAAHRTLAGYFHALATEGRTPTAWRTDRPRGLSELCYHLTAGAMTKELEDTLCDLLFVSAKCEAGMTYGLVGDFHLALLRGWAEQAGGPPDRVRWFANFVAQHSHIFDVQRSLVLPFAYNYAANGPVAAQAEALLSPQAWRDKPWIRLRNRPRQSPHPALRTTLRGHVGDVNAVDLTQDGTRAVSGGADGTIRVWDLDPAALGRCRRVITAQAGAIHDVAVSRDGSWAAAADNAGGITAWDLRTGVQLGRCRGHQGAAHAIAIAPDERRIVTGGSDALVKVWSWPGLREEASLDGHFAEVTTVAIAGDGRTIVSGSSDRHVRIWSLTAPGGPSRCLQGHGNPVQGVDVTRDGSFIISCSGQPHDSGGLVPPDLLEASEVRLWDADGDLVFAGVGHEIAPMGSVARGVMNTIVFGVRMTPDGSAAVSGGFDRVVTLWNLRHAAIRARFHGHTERVLAVDVDEAARTAVSGSADATIRVWDLQGDPPPAPVRRQAVASTGSGRACPIPTRAGLIWHNARVRSWLLLPALAVAIGLLFVPFTRDAFGAVSQLRAPSPASAKPPGVASVFLSSIGLSATLVYLIDWRLLLKADPHVWHHPVVPGALRRIAGLLLLPLMPFLGVLHCPTCGAPMAGRRSFLSCTACGFTDRIEFRSRGRSR